MIKMRKLCNCFSMDVVLQSLCTRAWDTKQLSVKKGMHASLAFSIYCCIAYSCSVFMKFAKNTLPISPHTFYTHSVCYYTVDIFYDDDESDRFWTNERQHQIFRHFKHFLRINFWQIDIMWTLLSCFHGIMQTTFRTVWLFDYHNRFQTRL